MGSMKRISLALLLFFFACQGSKKNDINGFLGIVIAQALSNHCAQATYRSEVNRYEVTLTGVPNAGCNQANLEGNTHTEYAAKERADYVRAKAITDAIGSGTGEACERTSALFATWIQAIDDQNWNALPDVDSPDEFAARMTNTRFYPVTSFLTESQTFLTNGLGAGDPSVGDAWVVLHAPLGFGGPVKATAYSQTQVDASTVADLGLYQNGDLTAHLLAIGNAFSPLVGGGVENPCVQAVHALIQQKYAGAFAAVRRNSETGNLFTVSAAYQDPNVFDTSLSLNPFMYLSYCEYGTDAEATHLCATLNDRFAE
ncbi:putative lipoprotein [Leptospira sp. B5-022]|nr:putative lipoprotein [Leptospira sp. B5-022]